jgi:hypothetical protein
MTMTRREWGLLLVLLLAVAAVFVTLGYLILRPTEPGPVAVPLPEVTYDLSDATVTAKTVYPLAQEVARNRQADVQLASISATWGETNVKTVGSPTAWTFQFYSPETNRIYVVVVDQGQAQLIREAFTPHPSPPIHEESWPIDSDEALGIWLSYGGGQFLMAHLAGTKVVAQLAISPDGPQAIWTVAGLSERGQAYFTVLVDAATGAHRAP